MDGSSTHLDTPLDAAAATEPAPMHAVPRMPAAGRQGLWRNRLIGLAVLVPSLGLLLVAAGLTPSGRGYGTHTQLGLEPCGFEVAYGLPCATCGMTTAFALAADGRLVTSFLVQPAGMVLAVMTAMAAVVGGWTLVSGMSLGSLLASLWTPRVLVAGIAMILLAWLYTLVRAGASW